MNKGHLSNEETVCSPNHIELCTNLPSKYGHLSTQTGSWVPMVSSLERFHCYTVPNGYKSCVRLIPGSQSIEQNDHPPLLPTQAAQHCFSAAVWLLGTSVRRMQLSLHHAELTDVGSMYVATLGN